MYLRVLRVSTAVVAGVPACNLTSTLIYILSRSSIHQNGRLASTASSSFNSRSFAPRRRRRTEDSEEEGEEDEEGEEEGEEGDEEGEEGEEEGEEEEED